MELGTGPERRYAQYEHMIDSSIVSMGKSDSVEHHLPLKPVDFHVLLVLTDGDLHGYGIVKEIDQRTEGGIRLEPGNLYRYLRRLVDEGMVEPSARRSVTDASRRHDASAAPGGDRRRYYSVTPLGRAVLSAEAVRMRALVAAAEARIALPAESS